MSKYEIYFTITSAIPPTETTVKIVLNEQQSIQLDRAMKEHKSINEGMYWLKATLVNIGDGK